jgi:uncharacterized protein
MEGKIKGLLVVDKFFERTPDGPLLVGSRCRECGKVAFPRKKVCCRCFRDDCMETHPMAREGEIVTYSISHMSHIGMPTPYAFGYVYLPEDDLTIYTLFKDWDPPEQRLFIGQRTELDYDVIRVDPWGNAIIGYVHRISPQ